MLPGKIHRYITGEIVTPFILGLTVFTFVLLMGRMLRLAELMINKGVPFVDVFKLFAFLLPSFFVITVPLAFLLGILMGLGRLSGDSEVVAMKASGISLYAILRPVMVLATLVAILTAVLTLYAQPRGNFAFRHQIFEIAKNRADVGIQPRIFNDEFEGLVIYTNDLEKQSGVMKGVFISDERKEGKSSIVLAESGRLIPDREALTLTLRLEEGSIHRRVSDQEQRSYQIIQFASYDVLLDLGGQAGEEGEDYRKKDKEMTLAELDKAIDEASSDSKANSYAVEKHQRFALPFAPFVFALIGVPLSIQSSRSGRGGGFAISLCVALVYYFLLATAKTMGEEGFLPAAISMWIPNVVFLLGGLFQFHQAAQEKPSIILEWVFARARQIRRLFHRGHSS